MMPMMLYVCLMFQCGFSFQEFANENVPLLLCEKRLGHVT